MGKSLNDVGENATEEKIVQLHFVVFGLLQKPQMFPTIVVVQSAPTAPGSRDLCSAVPEQVCGGFTHTMGVGGGRVVSGCFIRAPFSFFLQKVPGATASIFEGASALSHFSPPPLGIRVQKAKCGRALSSCKDCKHRLTFAD